jgi:hypothetical protein
MPEKQVIVGWRSVSAGGPDCQSGPAGQNSPLWSDLPPSMAQERCYSPIRSDPSSRQRPARPPLLRSLSRRPTLPRAAAPPWVEGRDRTGDSPRRARPNRIGESGHPGSAGKLPTTSCDPLQNSFRLRSLRSVQYTRRVSPELPQQTADACLHQGELHAVGRPERPARVVPEDKTARAKGVTR